MITCGECGGEVRSRLVHYQRPGGGFDLVEHWQCLTEIAALRQTRSSTNPTHRVRVHVGHVDRSPMP